MSTSGLIEYKDASPEVRAVFDDIMATRKTDWVNNFWKALAHDPVTLKRTWESIKQIMAPGSAGCADQRDDLRRRERDQSVRVLYCFAYRLGAQERHVRSHVRRTHGRGGHGQRNEPARSRLPSRNRRTIQIRVK